MEWTKFLNLCGMLLGLVATIFLSKVLFANADEILHSTYHYSPMGWPSVAIISEKAAQKADTFTSIILVVLAIASQIGSVFVNVHIHITRGWRKAVVIAILLVGVVTITIYYVDVAKEKSYEMEIKKLAARDYVKLAVEQMSMPLYSDLQAIANQYFQFKKQDEESNADFAKRFATFLEYQLPENIDLSKFRDEKIN